MSMLSILMSNSSPTVASAPPVAAVVQPLANLNIPAAQFDGEHTFKLGTIDVTLTSGALKAPATSDPTSRIEAGVITFGQFRDPTLTFSQPCNIRVTCPPPRNGWEWRVPLSVTVERIVFGPTDTLTSDATHRTIASGESTSAFFVLDLRNVDRVEFFSTIPGGDALVIETLEII